MIGSGAGEGLPARAAQLDLERPYWELGGDDAEPYWLIQREDRHGVASAR
jgi:hypothetical protein